MLASACLTTGSTRFPPTILIAILSAPIRRQSRSLGRRPAGQDRGTRRRSRRRLLCGADPGIGRVLVPPTGWLKAMRAVCKEHDVLFVVDEVITGFGRTGPLFACEEDDVVPDFMTTAKGLTSGYVPMGAVFMSDHVYNTIADGAGKALVGHGYTYSAHPVSAAVGARMPAPLRGGPAGQRSKGRKASDGGSSFARRSPAGRRRSWSRHAGCGRTGDRQGAQDALPPEADPARRIFDRAWQNGLVIRAFANGVLGYAPPLCCTDEEIDGIIERTRLTLDQTLEDKDVRAAMKG